MLCVIHILMITILNISSKMTQVLSCFIVISHIIYNITYAKIKEISGANLSNRNQLGPF